MSWLWDELRDFFEVDDGGLYDLRLTYERPASVAAALTKLDAASGHHTELELWPLDGHAPLPFDTLADAARLVRSGSAGVFHLVFSEIEAGGVQLPDLGVMVHRDMLELDYCMGNGWNPSTLDALFQLLSMLAGSDPAAEFSTPDNPPSVQCKFGSCWRRFCAENGT